MKKRKTTYLKQLKRTLFKNSISILLIFCLLFTYLAYFSVTKIYSYAIESTANEIATLIENDYYLSVVEDNKIPPRLFDKIISVTHRINFILPDINIDPVAIEIKIHDKILFQKNAKAFYMDESNEMFKLALSKNHNISDFEKTPFDVLSDNYEKIPTLFMEKSSVIVDGRGNEVGLVTLYITPIYLMIIIIPFAILLLLLFLFMLILNKIFATHSAKHLIKPINLLIEKFDKVAKKTNHNFEKIDLNSKKSIKELDELMNSANIIISNLEQYSTSLQNKNNLLSIKNDKLIEYQHNLEETQAQLVQSEKLASLGQISTAIAHEINTPLGAISSNIQLHQMLIPNILEQIDKEEFEKSKQLIKKLQNGNDINLIATKKIDEIIKSLKNFIRTDEADFKTININESIQNVLILTRKLWKDHIQVETELNTIPDVMCFPSLLNQVFMNLIINAHEAIPQSGYVKIKSELVDDSIEISFSDTGVGIAEDKIPYIFDQGFTTKEKGTGFGLKLSLDIIKKHHGNIIVESTVDVGSCFKVIIPIKQP